MARVIDSWLRLDQEPNAGEQLALALERVQATGARLGGTWFASLPAQLLARAGRVEEALGLLGQALATCEGFHERWFEVELRRMRAALGEGDLEVARALARQQSARLWESRLP